MLENKEPRRICANSETTIDYLKQGLNSALEGKPKCLSFPNGEPLLTDTDLPDVGLTIKDVWACPTRVRGDGKGMLKGSMSPAMLMYADTGTYPTLESHRRGPTTPFELE